MRHKEDSMAKYNNTKVRVDGSTMTFISKSAVMEAGQ